MKERVEDIEEQFRWGLSNLDRGSMNIDDDDIDWLISYVKELDSEINGLVSDERELNHKIGDLIRENQRYKKALEEILEESYEEAGLHPDTDMQLETFITKTAREALND